MVLADSSAEAEAIFRVLARELLSVTGAEEVHVHHLAARPGEEEQVAVYMFDGYGRLSYLIPRSERPPGVGWVASTGRSFLAGDARELEASVPRLAAAGLSNSALLLPLAERGEVEAVVVLAGGVSDRFTPQAVELATILVDQAATALALVRARAEAGTDPITGFYRDGCCRTGPEDLGSHTVCAVVTREFLEHQRRIGNDLSTPMPAHGFPGLVPGDRWCLCAPRWQEAYEAGMAPAVILEATHARTLEWCSLAALQAHAASA